jgi:MFS family permease
VYKFFVVILAPEQDRGKYLGLFSCVFSLPLLLAPWIGSYLYESYDATVLWFSLGAAGIFVFLGFQRMAILFRFDEKWNDSYGLNDKSNKDGAALEGLNAL